jgi:cell division septal protein FtsQ
MKKFYRIILLLIVLIFLSTFNPKEFNLISKKSDVLFKIENIEIKNNFLINKSEIKEKLSNISKENIFFIKRKDIEEPLKEIDFLKKIEVKKKYPNTIIIKIFETKPVAILFKNKVKYIIDSSSNLISFKNDINFNRLPRIFGEEGENNFIHFLNQLKKNNFPNKKIKNFYYFQIGRWDLQLLNNKIIKFPHNNIDGAIIKSIELLNHKNFKNYNIIDLRIDGKIIVK